MLLSAMIVKVRTEAGIDATDAVIRAWLLDRIERMIVAAKWRRAEVAYANTVANVATYVKPADVVDVEAVKVNGEPYTLASIEELWDLKQGIRWLRGRGGVFAPYYAADGSTDGIELFSAPASTGLPIVALCSLKPPVTADNAEPPVPTDLQHGIWEGAIADGLSLMDEALEAAAVWEARFEDARAELERRRKSLIGSGPVQIRVHY